jgi:two-component system, chemotaxis family, protein-glutamate methylesterase/glutaminase
MKEMCDAGATTVAQDEATCVVYGMPKAAVDLGGAQKSVPLDQVARHLLEFDARHRKT